MNLVTFEINRNDGCGWQRDHAEDRPAHHTIDQIAMDVRRYANATGHAHQAKLNGILVAGYDPTERRTLGQRRTGL